VKNTQSDPLAPEPDDSALGIKGVNLCPGQRAVFSAHFNDLPGLRLFPVPERETRW
jgi:hypothetical protein